MSEEGYCCPCGRDCMRGNPLLSEATEWGQDILKQKPEPYYARTGLVHIRAILGADNEEAMNRIHQLIAEMGERGTMPTTRELFPNLTDAEGQRSLAFRRQS